MKFGRSTWPGRVETSPLFLRDLVERLRSLDFRVVGVATDRA